MGTADGARGVIGAAVAAAAGDLGARKAAAAGEQLALLPVPMGNPRAKHLRHDVERRNQAGRPPGAVNKSTAQLREWLLARGVHPLQRMMEWMLHTPQSLAAELGCTQLEAFDRLRQLWADAAPFFAPRLQPTDDQGNAVPFFQMVMGGNQVAIGSGASVPPWIYAGGPAPLAIEQNQALSEPAEAVSHGDVSHGEAK